MAGVIGARATMPARIGVRATTATDTPTAIRTTGRASRSGSARSASGSSWCFGLAAWSVFLRATVPGPLAYFPLAYVDEMAGDGCCCCHHGRHEMGAALVALAALEIAVRGRGAAFAGAELVGIHRQAHRAPRLAPVEARGREDLVEPLGLGLLLHQARAPHDHRVDAGVDLFALRNARDFAQVLDAAVGA